jgi:hypothetical protein
MQLKRFYIVSFLLVFNYAFFCCNQCVAQNNKSKKNSDLKLKPLQVKLHTKEIAIQGLANTNGYGIAIAYSKIKTTKIRNWYSLNAGQIKHAKEVKVVPQSPQILGYNKPQPYTYGKQNSLFTIGFNWQQNKMLLQGVISPNIDIWATYGIGISTALIKPYYLQTIGYNDNTIYVANTKYNGTNENIFLNNNKLYSSSKFSLYGNEFEIIAGLQMNTGIKVDFNKSKLFNKAVLLGIQNNIYTKRIPILLLQKANAIYPSLYFGIQLSKQW